MTNDSNEAAAGQNAAGQNAAGQNGREAKRPILSVRDLGVKFWVNNEWFTAAENISYDLHAGEVLAIVGESGSGKSQSSMSLLGLLPRNGRSSGSAKLSGRELIGIPEEEIRSVRGNDISVIFQEPMTALNPVYTVGFQIVETLRVHTPMGPAAAKQRALELMALVEIPEPEQRFSSFPHQLSGGQRQRIMIAQALACAPKLLIADEPTTALDVTVQAEILKLMRALREKIDSGIILITHDMGVVADMADRILVMRAGRVVESGTADEIFNRPQHEYTKALLAAVPHLGEHAKHDSRAGDADQADPDAVVVGGVFAGVKKAADRPAVSLQSTEMFVHASQLGATFDGTYALELENVSIEYPKAGRRPAFRAAHSINLRIEPGEVLGLVGESGSGKTTIGRAAVGLLPVVEGALRLNGTDIAGRSNAELRPLRRDMAIVFQDPGSSLNPRLPVGESIGEPIMLHERIKGAALSARVEALLDSVELSRDMRNRYPHELSGGQRQRIGIARALALQPRILVADEPTSALDVSVQVRVLEMFANLQQEYGFACLFVSHDLAVVEMVSDKVAVMRRGHLVEYGTPREVISHPVHPYTQQLLAAVPVPDPDLQRKRREARDALLARTDAP